MPAAHRRERRPSAPIAQPASAPRTREVWQPISTLPMKRQPVHLRERRTWSETRPLAAFTMLTTTRLGLVLVTLLVITLGFRFGRRQRAPGASGGDISTPKLAWLAYAVLLWFLVTPLIALDPALRPELRWVLGGFSAFMWIRGAAELYMLYVTRNWRPPYGIAHDLLCIGLLLTGLLLLPDSRPNGEHPMDVWAALLLALLLTSLVAEVVYAWLFHRATEGQTTGKDGVWFAADNLRFRAINRLTAWFNVPLFLGLGALLFGLLRS